MSEDRYHLSRREDGLWNVIDTLTGGPVDIGGVLLYGLTLEDADDLTDLLIRQDARLQARLNEVLGIPPSPEA